MISLRLLPDEKVEWTTRKGSFNVSLILGMFGTIGGIVIAAIGFLGGESDGQPFPPNPTLGWVGLALLLAGLGYTLVSFVVARSTKYVLTNHRIVETRFGKIVEEIPLADFMGKPVSQFFDKHVSGTVNKQPVYNIRITNPKSLDAMEFKSLNESSVDALERILERAREVVRCEYCKTSNSATDFVCSQCGAPLR